MSYAYISKVEVKNFRNFGTFTLHLEPTSVVLGENRVGKSNLLRALRLVLDPESICAVLETQHKVVDVSVWAAC